MIKILMLPSSLFLHDIVKADFQASSSSVASDHLHQVVEVYWALFTHHLRKIRKSSRAGEIEGSKKKKPLKT
ncbi:unnamed protein product [Brassica oleracea var. botrytis]